MFRAFEGGLAKFAVSIVFLACAVLSACGGGGGGGSAPPATAISGDVAPVAALPAVAPLIAPVNLVLPPSAPAAVFPAIAQTLDYLLDEKERTFKVSTATFIRPIDTTGSVTPSIGATPFAGDASLGQPNAINIFNTRGLVLGPTSVQLSTDTLGALPAFEIEESLPPGETHSLIAGYALPYSAIASPNGYLYQTFGSWVDFADPLIMEQYFSMGLPTDATTLPSALSGTYAGTINASYVEASTREVYDVISTVNATIDYATRTVTFSMVGSTALSANASGTFYPPKPELNMTGALTYAAGSNTFSGAVTSANGMTGNVTGRLYGPVLGSATPSKPIGAPPEIGGTFAVKLAGVGAMQGAFSAK